jgi:hypothetical protein
MANRYDLPVPKPHGTATHSSAGRPGTRCPVARRRRALGKRGRNHRANKKVIPEYRSRFPTQPVLRWHTPTDIRGVWAWAGSGFHVRSIHSNQPGKKALPGLCRRTGQEGGPPFNTSVQGKATHGCKHCTVLAARSVGARRAHRDVHQGTTRTPSLPIAVHQSTARTIQARHTNVRDPNRRTVSGGPNGAHRRVPWRLTLIDMQA